MKIRRIELLQETELYYITDITFVTWWGKSFTKKCYKHKGCLRTEYYESGDWIPIGLWEPVKVFLESGLKVLQFNA